MVAARLNYHHWNLHRIQPQPAGDPYAGDDSTLWRHAFDALKDLKLRPETRLQFGLMHYQGLSSFIDLGRDQTRKVSLHISTAIGIHCDQTDKRASSMSSQHIAGILLPV